MRRPVLLALGLVLTGYLAGMGVGRAAEPPVCARSSLPADIQQTLTKYFDPWKIQEPGTLAPETLSRWQAEAPTTCPGIISGHFQARRMTDYLVLLVDVPSQAYRLVAFREQMAGIYSFKVLELGNAGGGSRFLRGLSATMRANASLPASKEGAVLVSGSGNGLAAALYFWQNDEFLRQPLSYPSG